jgi:hypothetical protein
VRPKAGEDFAVLHARRRVPGHMAAKKSTSKKKAVAATGAARRKAAARPPNTATRPGFAAKLLVWNAIIDEAIAAKTKAAALGAYERADALDHLPVDLFSEDDADEAALTRAHTEMNRKLDERIRGLPAMSDMAHELCCLRDLINTT